MASPSAALTESTARPAETLLASQRLSDEELDGLLQDVCSTSIGTRRAGKQRLLTGIKSLDAALGGGLEGGGVVCVSGEVGAGGSEICRALLVNCLLEHDGSTAAVVDTTGNFDILRLYTLIVSQLQRRTDVLTSLRSSMGLDQGDQVEDVAAKVLDRVKIMRVFDFVGVREAISEIREGLEGRRNTVESVEEDGEAELPVRKEELVEKVPAKRTYVPDSEDEEDEEEMLFDTEATITQATPAVQAPVPVTNPSDSTQPTKQAQEVDADQSKIKFILIDNLAHVLNPLLKKDYIQANVLASTFLPTLTNLSQTHTLRTILLNPATPPRAPSPVRHPQNALGPPQQQRQEPPPYPSIFASNTAVPSLMNLLGRYADVHVLVGRLPRRKMDARVHYSDSGGGGGKGKKRGVEMVGVLEVVSDRWGSREGDWGSFSEGAEGVRDV